MKYLLLTVFSLTIVFSSCAKLDELSDDNSILGLTISEHWPRSIEIDNEPQYAGDTIFIPVVYGKYNFPLYFRANLKVDSSIDKVLGIDFDKELVLNSMDDQLKFYVMAKSGKTRVYIIKAKETIPLQDNNYILSEVDIATPEGDALFGTLTTRASGGDTIKLSGIRITYPIRITPKFTLTPQAQFRNFDNGTTNLIFSNASSVHRLKVVSQSGAERIWNIQLKDLPLVNSSTKLPGVDVKTTVINPRLFKAKIGEGSASSGIEVTDDTSVDNTTNKISIVVDSKSAKMARMSAPKGASSRMAQLPTKGIEVLISFPIFDGVSLTGISKEVPVVFSSYDEVKTFHMFDPIAGAAREWTVTIEPYLQNQADVKSFSFTYTNSDVKIDRWLGWGYKYKYDKSIILDPNFVEIYPNDGKIFVKATAIAKEWYTDGLLSLGAEYNYDWKLVLKPTVTLSKGAVSDISTFEWKSNLAPGVAGIGTKANDCWKSSMSFKVTAEDGTVKDWSLTIIEPGNSVSSDLCELLSFGIEKLVPNYTLLDKITPTIKDDKTNTITIKLADYDETVPLEIYPTFAVSEYASIESDSPMVFNNPEQTHTIKIKARDGVNYSDWTVKLLVPEKSVGAEIETFAVSSVTPDQFKLKGTSVNAENGSIRISLDSDGAYPLKVNYRLTSSEGSTPSIPLIGEIEFTYAREIKTINVKAQNGSEKLWVIQLDYRPQIANSNFNSWSDNKTLSGTIDNRTIWANANNSFTPDDIGTLKGTGRSGAAGDFAPTMISGAVMGKPAAGSTFTGYFTFATSGASDPVALTFQGHPFSPSIKITGVQIDVWYSAAGDDYGSLTAELVAWDGARPYVYHGNRPGPNFLNDFRSSPHPANTATSVARTQLILKDVAGRAPSGQQLTVIPRNEWVTVTIPMSYGAGPMPTFTHFNFICSSSAYGDAFKSNTNSKLMIDNMKILYEE